MPKLIAILAAVLVGAVIALGLCQVLSGREGIDYMDDHSQSTRAHWLRFGSRHLMMPQESKRRTSGG